MLIEMKTKWKMQWALPTNDSGETVSNASPIPHFHRLIEQLGTLYRPSQIIIDTNSTQHPLTSTKQFRLARTSPLIMLTRNYASVLPWGVLAICHRKTNLINWRGHKWLVMLSLLNKAHDWFSAILDHERSINIYKITWIVQKEMGNNSLSMFCVCLYDLYGGGCWNYKVLMVFLEVCWE